MYAVGTVICIWLFIGLFGTAFSCGISRPWDYIHGKCINRVWTNFLLATESELMSSAGLLVDILRDVEHSHGFRSDIAANRMPLSQSGLVGKQSLYFLIPISPCDVSNP